MKNQPTEQRALALPVEVRVRRVIRGSVRPHDDHRKGVRRNGQATKPLPIIREKWQPKAKGKGGMSTMTPERLAQIKVICHLSCSPPYTFISQYLGVPHTTFMHWLKVYKGFRQKIDKWRAEGVYMLRTKAYKIATRKHGDPKMLRYLLDRLDPQFRPKTGLEIDVIPPNYDRALDRPDIL